MAEVSAESPSAELNRPGVRQAQGSSPSRQSLPDLNPSFDPHLTNDEPGTSAVASYSARAKIAGVKIILLAPVEKRKRTGPDRCKGGAETRAPLGGGSGERSEMAGAVKAEELGQQVTEVAQESGRRREDSGSFAGSDFRMGRGLVGSQAAAVRGEGEGREQPGALTGEATTFGSKLQAKRQTECVEFHRRLIVDKSPIRSSSAESLQSAEENRFEQGSKSLGVAAQAAAGLEEDDFSDALDYEETDGQDSADNGASAIPMHAKFPGRGWGVDDVSNGDSGSRDEFGSANDVQRLENDWLGGIGTRGPEPPCEIVEREWSPEPTEHEAIELRTNVADFSGGRSTGPNAGGVHVGKSSGGLDPREVSGGWNGGEVALEMPLDNESEEEDGYGMRPAEPQMASVFGRESLLAWSGAGSEHWNGGYETEDVAGSASYPPEKEWDREGLGFATLEDRGVLRDEGTANPAEEELSGADSPGTAEYELKGQEEAGEELESPRDYLEAVCTGLSFSVAVSASSTSIEIASDTLEIAEVLHSPQVLELGSRLDVARDSAMPPRESAHKLTPRERRLQQVEAALPSPYGAPQPFTRSGSQTRTFPFAVSSSFSTNGNAPDAPLLSEQLSMSERRKLVKVRSGPPITKPAVAVSVLISPGGSTGRVDGGPNHARGKALGRQSSLLGHADPAPRDTPSTEVKAELQPVTLFLDLSLPERLKRFAPVSGGPATPVPAVTPVPLLRASQVLPSPRRSFEDFLPSQVLPRPGSSPVDDIIDDLDRQLSGSDAGLLRSAEAQQGALSITVSSSCFRTILSFPEENDSIDKDAAKKPTSRPNVGAPYRGDFLALDLFSGSSPNDQPAFLSYKIEPPELYLRRSFSSAPSPEPESSVCLGAADLGFYLVTDSYFTTGGSAQAPGYRAFSLLSVSKQPGPPSRQKPPWKPARLSSPVDESGLGVSLDVRMRPAAESGDWLAQLAWDATSAQKTRGDGKSCFAIIF